MPESPIVSIIIPVCNVWDKTLACLRSLGQYTKGHSIEIIVVDNHSTDATSTELTPLGASLFGQVFRTLRMAENLGFAKACNAGAAAASAPLLYFLNNDTVVTPNWLGPQLVALDAPEVGAVGPLLLYPDNTVQHCGIYVTPFGEVGHLYEQLPASFAAARRPHTLQAITAAAMLLRARDFWDCGGFHEGYVNGFEDVDLCLSLGRKGLGMRVEPRSIVWHHASQTPGRFLQASANSALLTQRQGQWLIPDMHALAASDGYELHIGPTLSTWLALPDRRQAELTAAAKARPALLEDVCRRLLEREPLWRQGWLLLTQSLLQRAGPAEALKTFFAQWWLFPDEATLRTLQDLHIQVYGFPDVQLGDMLRKEQEADLTTNAQMVRQARKKASARHDLSLLRLCDTWLERYAPAEAGV